MSNINTSVSMGFTQEIAQLMPEFWASSPIGFCLSDEAGVIVAVNPAFAEAVGLGGEELVGLHIMRLVSAENAVRGSVAHTAFIAGDDHATADMTYVHQSGRPLFAHVSDSRLQVGDRRIYRLTTLVDLGSRAGGIRQLSQYQQVENFAALASDISNDFNNLLSIVLGYTALLKDGAPDAKRVNTAINGIGHAVQRASNLIRQTLHLSRRGELAFERVDVAEFLREYFRMTGPTIAAGLNVSFDFPTELAPVSLDTQQFHQIVTNLAQKSRELSGSGGKLTMTLRSVNGIEVKAKFPDAREKAYVELAFRVEPSADEFVAGYRPGTWAEAVRFTERRNDLTMLVVYNIVALHRAHLEIDALSSPALVFKLFMPALLDTISEEKMPVAIDQAGTTTSRTVLVVDDEEMFLQALDFMLTRRGFTVIKARDGVQAVEEFTRNADRISLVVLDLGLPRMSGWEAFLKIKRHSPAVNAVIMSGHLEANLKSEIMKAGAKGYLQKPFTMDEVLDEVSRFFAATN